MMFLVLAYLLVGLIASGILFAHQRLLTLLATGGVLAEGFWLVATFVQRTFLSSQNMNTVYIGCLAVIALTFLFFLPRFKFPYSSFVGSGRRDLYVLVPMALLLASAFIITRVNGFKHDYVYVMHGFYNGDTVTFASLVQRSLQTPGLVSQNPFSGNGPLEYPTLLHGAVAGLFQSMDVTAHDDWLYYLGLMVYVQIFLTVPMFFLLYDMVWPEPLKHERFLGTTSHQFILALQALLVVFVLAIAFDNFIYPQSHFFLTALFLLVTALFLRAGGLRDGQGVTTIAWASVLSFIVMRSNAVTGTATVGVACAYFLSRALAKHEARAIRVVCLAIIALFGLLFIGFNTGHAGFGFKPHFSYTGASDLLYLSAPALLLGVGLFVALGTQGFLSLSVTVLMLMALVTFFFSQRAIVVANSGRFFYHAFLVGFPLCLPPIAMAYYWAKRQLVYSTRTVAEKITGWVVLIACLTVLFIMPAGAGVASAFSHLLHSDEQTITSAMRIGLWKIQDITAPDAVFLASPYAPWDIPFFTGRSLLRTSYQDSAYWLSQDDTVLQDVKIAFDKADKDAQKRLYDKADYLYLTKANRSAWEPLPFKKIADTNAIVIYKLK